MECFVDIVKRFKEAFAVLLDDIFPSHDVHLGATVTCACVCVFMFCQSGLVSLEGFFGRFFWFGQRRPFLALRCKQEQSDEFSPSDVRAFSGGPDPLYLTPLQVPLISAATAAVVTGAAGWAGAGVWRNAALGLLMSISSVPSAVPRAGGEERVRGGELQAAIEIPTFAGINPTGDSL